MSDTQNKSINDGGPAFPTESHGEQIDAKHGHLIGFEHKAQPGMSLRDYFAGQALAAALSNPSINLSDPEHYAFDSYAMADKMIEARRGAK